MLFIFELSDGVKAAVFASHELEAKKMMQQEIDAASFKIEKDQRATFKLVSQISPEFVSGVFILEVRS